MFELHGAFFYQTSSLAKDSEVLDITREDNLKFHLPSSHLDCQTLSQR